MPQVARNTQAAGQTETQATQVTRERMDLTTFRKEIVNSNGEVVGTGLILTNPSHLEESDQGKETLGGLLQGFVDPVSGKPCTFAGNNGDIIVGGCPIRLFGEDAAVMAESLGSRPAGAELHLLLDDGADAAVYRKETGEVAFLVLRIGQIKAAGYKARRVASL